MEKEKKFRQVQLKEVTAQNLDRLKALTWIVTDKKHSASDILDNLVNAEIEKLQAQIQVKK